MRTILHRFVFLAAALSSGLMAGTGCTVKEDREPCPAYLNVSFADRESIVKNVGMLGYNGAEIFRESIDVAKYDPYWVKAVHKGIITVSAYYGVDGASTAGHHVTIPIGNQCDSLYAFHEDVDCTGDMAYADVTLHKQFCTVYMDLNKPLTGQNSIDHYYFLVEGNTCGFDLLNFEAVPGSFRIEPRPEEGERIVTYRIPRQVDDSMTVTVWFRTDDGKMLPEEGMKFPIGQYIKKLGYNWSAEDLQDIYVKIDFVAGFVTISVDDWEDGYVFGFIEQ